MMSEPTYLKGVHRVREFPVKGSRSPIPRPPHHTVRNGLPAVTDGPFAEAKEQLAGFYVLDAESLERATEIVTRDPAARFWAVEVRPIMDTAGAEM
jgi:hypothetical protein